jgi:hypothetical protein
MIMHHGLRQEHAHLPPTGRSADGMIDLTE